jgi:large subunit ribosomal protein L6
MSRIGQKPIDIPSGVTLRVDGVRIQAKGSVGELSLAVPDLIQATIADGKLLFTRRDDTRQSKSLHGLMRSLAANMVAGVSKGYTKELEIQGVGFKASVQAKKLSLALGFAGPVLFTVPDGVKVTEEGGVRLVVSGADKQLVGDVAARIRGFFPAEPYKGKGIRYKGEHVRRKVGKTVA